MAIETFKILNNMSPSVLLKLSTAKRIFNISLDIQTFYRYQELEHLHTVRGVLAMQQQSYGTAFQMNSDNWTILINLKP